jgi:protein-histidine pros-kinase
MKSSNCFFNANVRLLSAAVELISCGIYVRPNQSGISYLQADDSGERERSTKSIVLSHQLLESLGHEAGNAEISLAEWQQLFHPDDLPGVEASIAEATESGNCAASIEIEYRLLRGDGTYRWTRETGRLVNHDDSDVWLGTLTDIDAEKSTSIAIAQQRYEAEAILETIPTYIWVKDAETRILQVNRAAAEVTGISKDQIEGQLTADVYPIDAKRYAESDRQTLEAAGVSKRPEMLHGQTGQQRSMLIDKYKLTHSGHPDRILVVGTDVTEIEAARQKLMKSEERFRQLFDSAPIGMLLIDSDGKIQLSNAQANQMFGFEEERSDVSVAIHIPQLFSDSLDENANDITRRRELTAVRLDGSTFTIEVTLTRELYVNDRSVTLASISDVTERAINEQRLNLAIEAGNVGFWEYVPDTGDVLMSKQALRQIGRTDGWTGLDDWTRTLHPEDASAASTKFQKFLDGELLEYEQIFRLLHNDGEYRSILSRARLIKDESGKLQRVVGFHIDVTDQQVVQAELERSNFDLNRFAYVASHDLKAPLRRILHLAEWVEEDSPEPLAEISQSHLGRLRKQAEGMNRLLDDLLSYSRVDRVGGQREPVDINALVPQLFEFLAPPEHVELQVTGELPKLTTARTALEQVLRNLIANAIQHSGGEQTKVVVSYQLRNGMHCFCVEDFGKGIEPIYHERIFELFQSLEADSGIENTGMGLALVKRLCERVGGKVWVESELGEGARFFFTWV